MSSNQLHGKRFEDILKATFPGSSDESRFVNSAWDIESKFDDDNLPISIKSKKFSSSITIEMADARRFFNNNEEFKLIISLYKQDGDIKSFYEVYQFTIRKKDLKKLKGSLKSCEVNDFHNELKQYPPGAHHECRQYAKSRKSSIDSHGSFVKLNPKIDSKAQRRLQCSITLSDLLSTIPKKQTTVFKDSFRGLVLPVRMISEKRTLR